MSQQTLLLVEATGIQEYIFGSNQLAQNIGASELVQQATTDWVYELLPSLHNVTRTDDEQDGWKIDDRSLGSDDLAAEVVYAGGGNAMILFAQETEAVTFAKRLTRRILEHAPGLGIVLKRKAFDSEQDVLKDVHQALRGELSQRKLNRPASVPLLGLGVTAACKFTGAPAVGYDKDGVLISAEIQAKLKAEDEGKDRLRRHLGQKDLTQASYDFVYDFGDLGSKGTSSYLAVIHTDGNDMGERIKEIGKNCPAAADNVPYARKLRAFSASVANAARTALNRTVTMLIAPAILVKARDEDGHVTTKIGGVVPVPERDGKDVLPFRPIVFGGDDVTFVCEGRLGLEVAAKYLQELSTQILGDGKRAYARAGVAIAKTHYPFSRTYELAGALCKSAKDYIRKIEEEEQETGVTALDWHFAVGGLVLPLGEVRRREYTAENNHSLLMRPVYLGHLHNEWRSWDTFATLTETFLKRKDWAGRRNKVKALRDALRTGPEAVKLLVQTIRKPKADPPLPPISGRPEMQEQGWQGRECGYFDAVEAMDFFVGLEGGTTA